MVAFISSRKIARATSDGLMPFSGEHDGFATGEQIAAYQRFVADHDKTLRDFLGEGWHRVRKIFGFWSKRSADAVLSDW